VYHGRGGIAAGATVAVVNQRHRGSRFACDLRRDRNKKSLLKVQQINKSDWHDARGIAQMMRVDLFKNAGMKSARWLTAIS
jgi:hypothetical protein